MRAITVNVFDDIDGPGVTPAVITDLAIGYKGQWYQVDLGERNLKLVTEFLEPIIIKARACDEAPKRPGGTTLNHEGLAGIETPRTQPSNTQREARTAWLKPRREWARVNGWPELSKFGTVPVKALEAYEAAHGGGE